jgi:hypothetical protein
MNRRAYLSENQSIESNTMENEIMPEKKVFTKEQALELGEGLGIDWSRFDVEQFRTGLDVELEHGSCDPLTNVTDNDPRTTAKIALAHLSEFPDYYTRLERMEQEAEAYWERRAH